MNLDHCLTINDYVNSLTVLWFAHERLFSNVLGGNWFLGWAKVDDDGLFVRSRDVWIRIYLWLWQTLMTRNPLQRWCDEHRWYWHVLDHFLCILMPWLRLASMKAPMYLMWQVHKIPSYSLRPLPYFALLTKTDWWQPAFDTTKYKASYVCLSCSQTWLSAKISLSLDWNRGTSENSQERLKSVMKCRWHDWNGVECAFLTG